MTQSTEQTKRIPFEARSPDRSLKTWHIPIGTSHFDKKRDNERNREEEKEKIVRREKWGLEDIVVAGRPCEVCPIADRHMESKTAVWRFAMHAYVAWWSAWRRLHSGRYTNGATCPTTQRMVHGVAAYHAIIGVAARATHFCTGGCHKHRDVALDIAHGVAAVMLNVTWRVAWHTTWRSATQWLLKPCLHGTPPCHSLGLALAISSKHLQQPPQHLLLILACSLNVRSVK